MSHRAELFKTISVTVINEDKSYISMRREVFIFSLLLSNGNRKRRRMFQLYTIYRRMSNGCPNIEKRKNETIMSLVALMSMSSVFNCIGQRSSERGRYLFPMVIGHFDNNTKH